MNKNPMFYITADFFAVFIRAGLHAIDGIFLQGEGLVGGLAFVGDGQLVALLGSFLNFLVVSYAILFHKGIDLFLLFLLDLSLADGDFAQRGKGRN